MTNNLKIKKTVGLSLLSALIIVLQLASNFIKFGPFSITLALTPIIIGGALYGVFGGTFLGFVFSLSVAIYGLLGIDGGSTLVLFNSNFLYTILLIFLKGILAGLISAMIYKIFSKNNSIAVLLSGLLCPIVNTGVFFICMFTFFYNTLVEWSGETAVFSIIVAIAGWNFIIEFIVNIVLSSAVARIITLLKTRH